MGIPNKPVARFTYARWRREIVWKQWIAFQMQSMKYALPQRQPAAASMKYQWETLQGKALFETWIIIDCELGPLTKAPRYNKPMCFISKRIQKTRVNNNNGKNLPTPRLISLFRETSLLILPTRAHGLLNNHLSFIQIRTKWLVCIFRLVHVYNMSIL